MGMDVGCGCCGILNSLVSYLLAHRIFRLGSLMWVSHCGTEHEASIKVVLIKRCTYICTGNPFNRNSKLSTYVVRWKLLISDISYITRIKLMFTKFRIKIQNYVTLRHLINLVVAHFNPIQCDKKSGNSRKTYKIKIWLIIVPIRGTTISLRHYSHTLIIIVRNKNTAQ